MTQSLRRWRIRGIYFSIIPLILLILCLAIMPACVTTNSDLSQELESASDEAENQSEETAIDKELQAEDKTQDTEAQEKQSQEQKQNEQEKSSKEIPENEESAIGTTHTVWLWQETRDCLWNLAKKYYGDPWLWKKIYIANKDKIDDPQTIYPKQVLIIPPK